jgi:hypothetical protein
MFNSPQFRPQRAGKNSGFRLFLRGFFTPCAGLVGVLEADQWTPESGVCREALWPFPAPSTLGQPQDRAPKRVTRRQMLPFFCIPRCQANASSSVVKRFEYLENETVRRAAFELRLRDEKPLKKLHAQ